ncbi:hypothetical protein L208DRAFT_23572 [Tricholoma matsutake]|nr:hypothetical protein L208DRAFT_23572 [Tricholoma matsutake 945]
MGPSCVVPWNSPSPAILPKVCTDNGLARGGSASTSATGLLTKSGKVVVKAGSKDKEAFRRHLRCSDHFRINLRRAPLISPLHAYSCHSHLVYRQHNSKVFLPSFQSLFMTYVDARGGQLRISILSLFHKQPHPQKVSFTNVSNSLGTVSSQSWSNSG